MTTAREEDVVLAFRQELQAEIERLQSGQPLEADIFAGASLEEALRRLTRRHEELVHEVALLRTIVLRLMSEPVDGEKSAAAGTGLPTG